jgi:hypothetical protein
MPVYDSWAKYYDLIHEGLPGDVDFYVNRATASGGPALEIGVGTGRIAVAMAQAGVDVTGLDDSPAMLSLCRARKRVVGRTLGHLTLVRADMRGFDVRTAGRHTQFRFIGMPYRTFLHLMTPEEQRACLRCVRHHMARDSTFIVDTWTPNARFLVNASRGRNAERLRHVGRFRLAESGHLIEHYQAHTCSEFHQCLTEIHVFREMSARGRVLHEEVIPLVRVWTSRREMQNLLLLCGLDVEMVYADFSESPAGDDSTTLVWVLRKGRTLR